MICIALTFGAPETVPAGKHETSASSRSRSLASRPSTIDENVRYARPDASIAEVQAALEAAGIAAFVASLPDGLRTRVGDRGLALSAGERQRLALARAFLADPAVLILDEPSAALDPVAERLIIDGYRRVMRGRTTILISHRLELIRTADHVVVLDGARVVEHGSPAALEHRGGAFSALFAPDLGAALTTTRPT